MMCAGFRLHMVKLVCLASLLGPPGLALQHTRSPARLRRDILRVQQHRARLLHVEMDGIGSRSPTSNISVQAASEAHVVAPCMASPSGGRRGTLHGLHRPEVSNASSTESLSCIASVGPCTVPAMDGDDVEPIRAWSHNMEQPVCDTHPVSVPIASRATVPSESVRSPSVLLGQVLDLLATSSLAFAGLHRAALEGKRQSSVGRQRGLFPLPMPRNLDGEPDLKDMVLICVLGLNALQNNCSAGQDALPSSGRSSAAQTKVLELVTVKSRRLLDRFRDYEATASNLKGPAEVLEVIRGAGVEPPASLVAARVDLPAVAGTCDPLLHIDPGIGAQLRDPSYLFPDPIPETVASRKRFIGPQSEYLRLTAKMLECGKVRLMFKPKASASTFAIGKRESMRLREVWSGNHVSRCARTPPKPPRLGNPAVFVRIRADRPLIFSKRDAKAYFDLLKLPIGLRPFFGRPVVHAGPLAIALGVDLDDLRPYLDDGADVTLHQRTVLTPVAATWPMGFSWSSCVAQAQMVVVCEKAGFKPGQLLSLEHRHPLDQNELATVATDDVIMVHTCPQAARDRLAKIDAALDSHGIERNVSKDVQGASSITALGCLLSNDPTWAEPDIAKLYGLLCGIVGLCHDPSITPIGFAGLLGVAQWFAQLSRWHFSIFSAVYSLQRREPPDQQCQVPASCLMELLVYLAVSPLLPADLARPFNPVLVTCDASPAFGFGVSVRECSELLVTELSTKSEQHGDFLRMTLDAVDADEKDRRGTPVRLPFAQSSFKDVISMKARHVAHSGAMEAHGLLLAVQWILRSVRRFSSRTLIGIDAKVVLFSAIKGRTSAPTLAGIFRSIAAHCLAADLLLYPLYVPSESNPADAPSRGVRRRPPIRRTLQKPKYSRLDRCLHKRERAWRSLRETGMASSTSSSSASRISTG
jgi:hypothetical protein